MEADGNTSAPANMAVVGKTDAAALEEAGGSADCPTAAALRTQLPYYLKHGVLVSMRDRRIARKIWNHIKAQYPAKTL
jgi:hypothetical protein